MKENKNDKFNGTDILIGILLVLAGIQSFFRKMYCSIFYKDYDEYCKMLDEQSSEIRKIKMRRRLIIIAVLILVAAICGVLGI